MLPNTPMTFTPATRYPDPAIITIDASFAKYRLFSSTVEQLGSGMRWAEGPVWFGDGRYLLVSDIPNNRVMKWDEANGSFSAWREPANFANGHARDRQGRLVSCEHLTRRITRTEHDGRITVLADQFQGKKLNSPNDITVSRDGSVWFTDPTFGILSDWEGAIAPSENAMAVYRIAPDGGLHQVIADLNQPNGLCFSPDEKTFYVLESRASPHRLIWQYDVGADYALSNKRVFCSADGPGAFDGFAADVEGNLWCGFGGNGTPEAKGEELDGVRIYNPTGKLIGFIRLPERCANLCFGGTNGNRLFMAASHSLYSLFVNTRGAVWW
jgi:gluconolactonase